MSVEMATRVGKASCFSSFPSSLFPRDSFLQDLRTARDIGEAEPVRSSPWSTLPSQLLVRDLCPLLLSPNTFLSLLAFPTITPSPQPTPSLHLHQPRLGCPSSSTLHPLSPPSAEGWDLSRLKGHSRRCCPSLLSPLPHSRAHCPLLQLFPRSQAAQTH